MKPSALLVLDCANVNRSFTVNGQPAVIDYGRLPGVIEAAAGVELREAVACEYLGIAAEHLDHLESLRMAGYSVVNRRLRAITGPDGARKLICNMDAEVTNEALLRSHAHDVVVIGSGDADFVPLVECLRREGKKVMIAGNKRSISRQLAESVGFNRVIELNQYQKALALGPGTRLAWPNHMHRIERQPAEEIGRPPKSDAATLLVDASYLLNRSSEEGWRVNWRNLASEAESKYGDISSVVMFDRGPKPAVVQDLYAKLAGEGWQIELKAPKASGACSCAVEMACAAIQAAKRGDSVVLVTGSGHLLPTVRRLKENGVAVGLMSLQHGLSAMMRSEFSPEAFYDMTALRARLDYQPLGLFRSNNSWATRPALPTPRPPRPPGQEVR